ncbi:RDD family protein [Tahibacter sp.]|uniref:RDD family protein n=1 Tax=Tahibacter sp. TaxID=2056211 RepID=UPI0028C4C614|nr:RDD family protein [Tahibacter sp.]
MDENNPYANPTTRIADAFNGPPDALAGRGVRLGAAILDGLLLMAIVLPIQWFGGFLPAFINASRSGYGMPTGTIILWAAIGFTVFVLVQGWPLHQSGQTWGKRLLEIRIVDLKGNKPPLWRLLVLRYLVLRVIGQIPIVAVGVVIGLLNPLLIFRADRRCLHDHIAGTKVIVDP